jgi:hypothetical protein
MKTTTRPLKRSAAALLLLAFSVATARADATEDRIAGLQAKFRCPIFEYLVALHDTSPKLKDRYLIVEIVTEERYYTQCIFFSKDRKMHCEAESEFYHPRLGSYFTPERRAVLKSLGYSTRATKNNYKLERKVTGIESLYDIAALYVDTLARVFDMQLDETLKYEAPRVPIPPAGGPETKRFCQPKLS